MTDTGSTVILHTDGASRGNPGPASAGVVIAHGDKPVFAGGFFLGRMTNNQAEYHGLLLGLEQALAMGASSIIVRSDSELLVRQINGQYRVKNADLKPLVKRALDLLERFDSAEVGHVRREGNARADALANQALDAKANVGGAVDAAPAACTRPRVIERFVAQCEADGCDECPGVISSGGLWEFDGVTPQGLCVHAAAGILQAVAAAKDLSKPVTARCGRPGCGAKFTVRAIG